MTLSRIGLFVCFGSALCAAETFDIISRPTPPAGTDVVIRIDRPNPKQPSTDYPQITFQPGDTVTIHAGGCVQSGGHGNTWHQYVTPTGGDADRYYHGLITIPFATGVLERIQKYWNKSVHIADTAPAAKLHLQLGFEDEKGAYGDNGYTAHDNGPGNQCAGPEGGPAWVQLNIVHHGPTTAPPSADSWDLVLAQFDDNGIPLNPDWESNVAKKQFPNPATCRWPWQSGPQANCTTGITNTDFDTSAGYSFYNPISVLQCASCSLCQSFSANYGYGGHANWMPATQTGTVFWEEKSAPELDDEYSVNLDTPNAAGATGGRPDGVHVEFDASETIDILTDDLQLPWWQQFRSAAESGDEQAHSFLDNKSMIVSGLMGVDFAHSSAGPENHPAWAMAVHANEDFIDDTWAFFVRSFGDEGFCSEQQHYISYLDNQYTFRFPWPAGATSGTVTGNTVVLTNGGSTSGTQVTFLPGQAVLLTLLNVPDQSVPQGLIGGELHISWAGSPVLSARRIVRPVPVRTPPEAGESIIGSALGRMTPAQRAIYAANAPKTNRTARPGRKLNVQTVPPSEIRRARTGHPTIRAVRDEALVARKNAQIEALKKAYGGTFPTK